MAKVITLVLALFTMVAAPQGSFAAEQDSKADTAQPEPKKAKKYKPRSMEDAAPVASAPRSRSLAAPEATGGNDGGRPDDTIGGLPGAKPDTPDRQP